MLEKKQPSFWIQIGVLQNYEDIGVYITQCQSPQPTDQPQWLMELQTMLAKDDLDSWETFLRSFEAANIDGCSIREIIDQKQPS